MGVPGTGNIVVVGRMGVLGADRKHEDAGKSVMKRCALRDKCNVYDPMGNVDCYGLHPGMGCGIAEGYKSGGRVENG